MSAGLEPLRLCFDVACSPEHAFHVWTADIAAWWPADRVDATDVDISFTATSDGATRVEVRHAGWERLGADASLWRERNTGGWNSLLPHFAAAAEDREVT